MKKEVIIIASRNRPDVWQLGPCLAQQQLILVPCETTEEIIDLLDTLPRCGVTISLVVIEPAVLKGIGDDLAAHLGCCSPDVPFTLLAETDMESGVVLTFKQICSGRQPFRQDKNRLTDILKENGITMASPEHLRGKVLEEAAF